MADVSFAPTKRFLLFLCAGAIFWPISSDIALLYLALLSGAALIDCMRFPRACRLAAKRIFPKHFVLGKEQKIAIIIENKSKKRLTGVICERFPALFSPSFIAQSIELPPGGGAEISCQVVPHERGEFFLEETALSLSGFFVQKTFLFSERDRVKVYPQYGLSKEMMALKFGEKNVESTMRLAEGAEQGEFDSLRPYIPGEELRNIDWKVTARRGELIAKKWTEDLHRHIIILIDGGRRMAESLGEYSRFDYALQAAIQLCHAAVEQGDSLSMISFSDGIDALMPETEKAEILPRMLETVYKLKPKVVESDYWQVFGQALLRLKKRSLLILFSDLLDMSDSAGMLSNLSKASQEHLVLCVILKNQQLEETANASPASEREWYIKGAACHMCLEKQKVLEQMKQMGVEAVEADACQFSLRVVESYLRLRKGG